MLNFKTCDTYNKVTLEGRMIHICFICLARALTICPVQRNIQWLPARHQEGGTKGSQPLKSKSGWEWTWPEQDLTEGEKHRTHCLRISWRATVTHSTKDSITGWVNNALKMTHKLWVLLIELLHYFDPCVLLQQVNFSNFGLLCS